jgi:hypothetical protein
VVGALGLLVGGFALIDRSRGRALA